MDNTDKELELVTLVKSSLVFGWVRRGEVRRGEVEVKAMIGRQGAARPPPPAPPFLPASPSRPPGGKKGRTWVLEKYCYSYSS